MKPVEIIRSYNGADVYMTETARNIQTLLVLDLVKFTNFDTTINTAFASNFLAAIVAAETVVADSAVIDQQVQKTESAAEIMDSARNKYGDVKYFAQKTFPNSLGKQGEFGLNDYESARRNPSQMIQFLQEMSNACVKYQPELGAKGFSAVAIAEILAIRNELITANSDKGVFKKQRPKLTEDRIVVLNTCFDFLTQVNAAAQLVYRSDFAKQKQFVYQAASNSTGQEFTGTVAANSTKTIATIAFDAANVFTFHNNGSTPLVFCLSSTNSVEGIEVTVNGGAKTTKTGTELNANATNLLVKNTDAVNEGSYLVEVEE